MKNIIITSIFFLSSIVCVAQEEGMIRKKADSLSQVSRVKADMVLNHFDSIKTKKILYSISDEYYFVVLKVDCCYKEYYIQTDSVGNFKKEKVLKTSQHDRKLLAKSFDLNNYHKDFITRVDSATAIQGNPSYFVVKDTDGKRYGEYALSVITVPVPIDKKLYNYLLKRLLKESTINNVP